MSPLPAATVAKEGLPCNDFESFMAVLQTDAQLCNIQGGEALVNTQWEEKGELGDKGGYNNHSGGRELVNILMLYRDVGRADHEEDGHPVLVPTRVLKRYVEQCHQGLSELFQIFFQDSDIGMMRVFNPRVTTHAEGCT
ncbi:hypothetical protein DV515_00009006 [Chloebia gouldiae]|uniref:Uncharacterized protein n=1 Tax=Chloebia gouldiae TaxID=44316 RepID=A0A3L8SCT0_CHLGU|nr:hypothetical protein DV515_00009006 [Chloebia gouldiae]